MKPGYIAQFEKLGFGLFVHFGLYSLLGLGEWSYSCNPDIDKKEYFSNDFANRFNPKKDWATKLVKQAKKVGAKYITLTTKHHEGFFLFDSKGLTYWDSVNLGPKRDLVKEFVDACNKEGIVPFFYHALLDWHNEDYKNGFPKYIDFLIKSVEVLCKNYGKIGGFWFDGSWDKPNANWEFDRLYSTIRKYQPETMIINNTGLSNTGKVGHYEIDSVTFERGHPTFVSCEDGKERAGEMCEVFGDHWGYAKEDIAYKPISQIISTLVDCRYYNCNLLLNVGPMGNGELRDLDKCYLAAIGSWVRKNKKFIYNVKKADIDSNEALLLKDDKYYYAVIKNIPMCANPNVQADNCCLTVNINGAKIKSAIYLDNNEKVELEKGKRSFAVKAFEYGYSYTTRVVRMTIKKD